MAGDLAAVDLDRTSHRAADSDQGLCQRRLARTGDTRDPDDFSPPDVDAHIIEHRKIIVFDTQPARLQPWDSTLPQPGPLHIPGALADDQLRQSIGGKTLRRSMMH